MNYQVVIGLEVHAELQTRSKMFCPCPVVDPTQAAPNTAVCPVCLGMPGVLPVVNQAAVDLGLRVAVALNCQVAESSLFARKNYFYPDLPKGYQISQYEQPLATHGSLPILTSQGERLIRVRRVHLEEDTGKLTHIQNGEGGYSLVDLNRAGIPLLEVVSEPELHSVEEVRAYAEALRALLRRVGASSGDMEKGAIRFEANVSLRQQGSTELGTRVEIKNLNSFRAMENAIREQITNQTAILEAGGQVTQETLGWDESSGTTFSQRGKEEAHDYRYFPEPDLPPLVIDEGWLETVRASLPELPHAQMQRFMRQYGLSQSDARQLSADAATAAYFERLAAPQNGISPRIAANWLLGEIFAWLNQNGAGIADLPLAPERLAELARLQSEGVVNLPSAKRVLARMLAEGVSAGEIITREGLAQVSDTEWIAGLVSQVLEAHPEEVAQYRAGKEALSNWFFGQVMKMAAGKANPAVVRQELGRQLREKAG